MGNKIFAATAALRVLESWGVKHFYGIPGGSTGSLMDAAYQEQDRISFIRVRHEEVGAMAASMHAKMTGHIGVVLGSAGPGGTHLMNGLYDAREDHVPVLALIGQMASKNLNWDAFQEMNENPIYADVSVYNRRVVNGQQLPHVIDEAIRRAYHEKGVAVVELPTDLGWDLIDEDSFYSSADNWRDYPHPTLNDADIDAAVKILNEAQRPVIYAGIGTRGNGDAVVELSKKIKAPIVSTAIAIDNFDDSYEAFLGSAGRVGRKTAIEAVSEGDVLLLAGTNYPFAEPFHMWDHYEKVIQIDINNEHLGKRHHNDATILGDAGDALRAITAKVEEKPESGWWRANVKNVANWREYVTKLETSRSGTLYSPQVFDAINKIADEDAIFSIDVGNTTMHSVRHLHLTQKNMWRTSPIFATMGIGLPGAISAALDFPGRQVFNLAGDGAMSMIAQDLATASYYHLPVISVVFTNKQFGFIKGEQEETNLDYFGVDFANTDFKKVAEGFHVRAFTVSDPAELDTVFAQAKEIAASGEPVLIDAKVSGARPLITEFIPLDEKIYGKEKSEAYKERFDAQDLQPLRVYLEEEGLDSRLLAVAQARKAASDTKATSDTDDSTNAAHTEEA